MGYRRRDSSLTDFIEPIDYDEESWDYADADTQYHVHGIHPYPARMIPQVAKRLILHYSKEGDTVLDPFCGSGTVLVEALLNGRNAIGVDINHLATLISRVKTTPINPEVLSDALNKIICKLKSGNITPKRLTPSSINKWFKPYVINDLSILKQAVDHVIKNEYSQSVYEFFEVALSMTVRKSSNIAFDDNPYFIRTMTGEKLKKHRPNVFLIFETICKDMIRRMGEFYKSYPSNVHVKVITGDARKLPLNDCSVDAVITSPPYGEESHTMSYVRFSKLSLIWLGYDLEKIRLMEQNTLGGLVQKYDYKEFPQDIQKIFLTVRSKNKKRAYEMLSYIYDYKRALSEVSRVVKRGGYICIVIGDRSVAGVKISNEVITKALMTQIGLRHVATFYRRIPKKVLPRSDYKVELINKESIIIFQNVG